MKNTLCAVLALWAGLGLPAQLTANGQVPTDNKKQIYANSKFVWTDNYVVEGANAAMAPTAEEITTTVLSKKGEPMRWVRKNDIYKFGKYLEKVIYMPVVTINEPESEQAVYDFLNELKPVAFELCWSNPESPVPAKMEKALKGRALIWYNTLWDWLCAGHNDDKAVDDPDGTWGYMIDTLGARILQTDRPQLMIEYLRSRNLHE